MLTMDFDLEQAPPMPPDYESACQEITRLRKALLRANENHANAVVKQELLKRSVREELRLLRAVVKAVKDIGPASILKQITRDQLSKAVDDYTLFRKVVG